MFSCCFFVVVDQAIAPYIPTSAVKLSSAIYEMVLYDFLKKDYKVITPGVLYSFLCIFRRRNLWSFSITSLRIQPSLFALRRLVRFAGQTSAHQRQKCHIDDVKSVKNLVRSSYW